MTAHRQVWDISVDLHSRTPAYPGDTPYQQTWTSRISADCPVNVGSMMLSTHLGTHVDAPLHYSATGESAGAMQLDAFIGPCRVIDALDCDPLVQWADIAHAITPSLPARVLLRTYRHSPAQWDTQLCAIAPAVIDQLAERGVRLIGIDTASIDPADSTTLPSHMRARAHGMRILENVVLTTVPEGDYELIALPLKLTEADASPVRAVLRTL